MAENYLAESERSGIAVAAYNRGVDDAKEAVRQTTCGDEDGYYKPCFITAIARYCGPERAIGNTYQCDACSKMISEEDRRGGIRAGGEGTFCPKCCGEKSALDAGEWRAVKRAANLIDIVDDEGVLASVARWRSGIAGTEAEADEIAAQIVSDHRSAAAVPKLVAALKALLNVYEELYTPDDESVTDAQIVAAYKLARHLLLFIRLEGDMANEVWGFSGMPMGKRSQSRVERAPRSLEIPCPVCNARIGQECFRRWKGDDERHSYERPKEQP